MPIYNIANEFLSFGRKVSDSAVPSSIKSLFKAVDRVSERWYFNAQTDETYQVQFILDKNDSWVSVWLDENDTPAMLELVLVTSTGKHHMLHRTNVPTIEQVVKALSASTTDEVYNNFLDLGFLDTKKRVAI